MNRAFKVARLQLANKWTLIGIPLVILAAGILVSLAIFTFIPGGSEKFSGAGQAPLWYFFAVGIQSLTLTFPFSQGLSVSRRAYYIGTVGLVLVLTLLWGVLYYLLGLLEDATNGWGVQVICSTSRGSATVRGTARFCSSGLPPCSCSSSASGAPRSTNGGGRPVCWSPVSPWRRSSWQ